MSTVGFGLKFTGDSRDAKRALKDVSGEIKGVGRAAKLMASPGPLSTSDAADDLPRVDLGGPAITKTKKQITQHADPAA